MCIIIYHISKHETLSGVEYQQVLYGLIYNSNGYLIYKCQHPFLNNRALVIARPATSPTTPPVSREQEIIIVVMSHTPYFEFMNSKFRIIVSYVYFFILPHKCISCKNYN